MRVRTRFPGSGVKFNSFIGGYVSFGSVVNGRLSDPKEVDEAIMGLSFSAQACNGICFGQSITTSGVRINQYGFGTLGVSVSTSFMKPLPGRYKNINNLKNYLGVR